MFEEMKDIDIRTVDKDTLTDVTNLTVNMDLPKIERMLIAAKQLGGNPYIFRVGNIAVKTSHADTTRSINDCFESFLRTQ